MTTALPDDGGSVLMDDTSSQWSSVADSEEERKSALEKSMYVFRLFHLYQRGIAAISHDYYRGINIKDTQEESIGMLV